MSLHPVTGEYWTRPGEDPLRITQVSKTKVFISRGTHNFSLPISEYLTLAAASQRRGDTLHRTETEDPMFE